MKFKGGYMVYLNDDLPRDTRARPGLVGGVEDRTSLTRNTDAKHFPPQPSYSGSLSLGLYKTSIVTMVFLFILINVFHYVLHAESL